MTRGTILPSLPPLTDDVIVQVCSSCQRRCCIFFGHKRRCGARKANESYATVDRTVGQLRALAAEHHSYWRHEQGDDPDVPKCIEDVRDLAEREQRNATEKPEAGWTLEERARLFAGYLTEGELGLDHEQCRDAIREAWPEAAAAIDTWLKEAS